MFKLQVKEWLGVGVTYTNYAKTLMIPLKVRLLTTMSLYYDCLLNISPSSLQIKLSCWIPYTQSSCGITDMSVMQLLCLPMLDYIFPCSSKTFPNCLSFSKHLAGLYKNGQLVEHPDCKPWVEDSYWEIKRSNNAIIEEAYKQFNGKINYACDLIVNYSILCLPGGILCNPCLTLLFLQMFFMNADSLTTEPLMWFLKLKDLWAWRSSQSSMPSELGYFGHIYVQHLATLKCMINHG